MGDRRWRWKMGDEIWKQERYLYTKLWLKSTRTCRPFDQSWFTLPPLPHGTIKSSEAFGSSLNKRASHAFSVMASIHSRPPCMVPTGRRSTVLTLLPIISLHASVLQRFCASGTTSSHIRRILIHSSMEGLVRILTRHATQKLSAWIYRLVSSAAYAAHCAIQSRYASKSNAIYLGLTVPDEAILRQLRGPRPFDSTQRRQITAKLLECPTGELGGRLQLSGL